jgi:hypothetical protein
MKVDKSQFDALLGKMVQAKPEPKAGIKSAGKPGKLIPAQPTPHKS